jgi:predicted membrane chloride channel (bestrophin family)
MVLLPHKLLSLSLSSAYYYTYTDAARHVAIFGFVLKAHLRGTISSDVINVMLPSPSDASYISSYTRKAPAAILVRLRQIFEYMDAEKKLDKEVRKALIQTTYKLNEALMTSERIRNTPIPPIYTAHTTRLLLFYLFWLPLALYGQLHDFSATLVVTLAVGYSLLGLDEISHIFELPFRLMPLYQLSKMAMMDSADAIVYRPPPIGGDRNLNFTQALPIYW